MAYTCGHWGDADLDKQVALYKTMRAAAPDTLLLMFSYQGLNNADAAAYAIKYLKNRGVNWSNAGIAWHGYTSPDAIIEVLNSFEKSTKFPASLCTEFFPGDTLNQEYNNIFESHFVGWTQFKWLGADDDELINLGRDLDQAGTVWIPDNPTATWPARGTPAIPKDGSRIGIYARGEEKYLSVDSMKGYRVKADRESFTGKRTEWFVVETITPGVVSLKAANGRYLSVSHESKPINADARTVSDTEKFIWMELPNGDVALRACGTGLFLSTAGEGAPAGQVRADARSGTSPRSNVAVLDGSAADS